MEKNLSVKITRIDETLPLPDYQTGGAVAFDLYSRIDATIDAHAMAMLPSNFIIEVPEGYALILASRSSLGKKKGLAMRNGIGVIDQDYSGPEDEIHLLLHNLTGEPVTVARGERLAQGLLVPVLRASWNEVEKKEGASRGGFGSTGTA